MPIRLPLANTLTIDVPACYTIRQWLRSALKVGQPAPAFGRNRRAGLLEVR